MRPVNCGRCAWCGEVAVIELPDDIAVAARMYMLRKRAGLPEFEMVQDQFPTLTAGQRETLMNGTHEACYDEMFPEDERR